MKAPRSIVALLLLLSSVVAVDAGEVPIPPEPTAWVTDTAGFLKPQTVDTLDARLHAYEASTGHQILIYIALTTGATPTEEWTIRAFTRWKVGRKSIDDGLVMFVFPTDHKVRIEVGYGLEETVPDAVAARIIRNTVAPKIRDGKPDDAVASGVDTILTTIGGEAVTPAAPPAQAPATEASADDSGQSPLSVLAGVLIAIAICFGVVYLIGKLPRGRGTYYYSGRGFGFGLWDVLSIGGGILGRLSGGGGGFSTNSTRAHVRENADKARSSFSCCRRVVRSRWSAMRARTSGSAKKHGTRSSPWSKRIFAAAIRRPASWQASKRSDAAWHTISRATAGLRTAIVSEVDDRLHARGASLRRSAR